MWYANRISRTILPSATEVPALVPRPGSIVWEYGGDARIMSTAGFALALQVAHPTVANGVREHSNYAQDPFGRLFRTLDYVYLMTYGGPTAAANTGRRMREMHKQIKGIGPDGGHYHALEPEAFAWVHATLAEGIYQGHRHFGRPLLPAQLDPFWAEWKRLARMLGIRDEDLPGSWSGFRDYFDRMVEERLERSDVTDGVIALLSEPSAPPVPHLPPALWKMISKPLSRSLALATTGLLPPLLRSRLDLAWTRSQDLELRALARTSRALTPVLPRSVRNVGPEYLRRRAKAIDRGQFGAAADERRRLASAA